MDSHQYLGLAHQANAGHGLRQAPPADFFRWAWRQIGTQIPRLRGEANLAISGHDRANQVTARLISERQGIDVRATGNDAIAAVQNLVRTLPR
jgi:hypothetical protein